MWVKIFEKVILDTVGKIVSFFWDKFFPNNTKPSDVDWDDNIGDYLAGVENRKPTIKSDVDVDKWFKKG